MKPKQKPNTQSFRTIDDDEREELIRNFLPLVKRVVHRLAGRLPAEVDIKEMLNSGIIGLVDALEKYDPRHETNFSTYAQFRIRGTILDSFRIQDWVPRSLRHKAHKLENIYLQLEQELGRPADDAEVAQALSVDIDTLHKMLGEVSGVVMLSLEELGFGHGEERFRADESLPSSRPDPLNQLLDTERVEIIARALDRLPEKERLVITLYFYEELNLKEIGEIIGVTESRASQI
ncbi:MAG TPA: RNA polymerase sigma factor FliA, partial [Oligoflexia bacterium]|nr:RNA polymerase sigma factor FliA [Oligoflexia bacterium]